MKADRFIALDIGADFIRLGVFARHASGQLELLDHGSVAIDSDPHIEMAREAVVATALKRLLDERKPTVRKAVVSIEGQSVFSRLVKLPPVAADKVAQTIRHEAVQNIPFPIDEVVWDAHIVDASAPEPEVLLVAVKAELVDGLVHAVSANGLLVERVDVAPAALANAVRATQPTGTGPSLLVDAGKQSTNLVFIDGDRTFFRTLPVAGSMGQRLVQEIERSITFYRSQQGGNAPQRILLAGGLGHLGETESRLGIPVEAFDPLLGVQQSVVVADPGNIAVLAGLARSGGMEINLVPEALEKAHSFRRKQPLFVAGAAAAVLVAGTWIVGLNRLAALAEIENREVRARIQALERVEKKMLPLERRIAELQRQSEVYEGAIERRTFWLDVLVDIRGCLAEGMFVLGSEPILQDESTIGQRITVVSYLDREGKGEDAIIQLRDRLRAKDRFSEKTKVFKRPTKKRFAREFVLDVHFEEGSE
ncbi:type IV pilus biogenesis protein PilM [Pontiella desulfatans]|uniref:type IV pilus biogenesis protein PilM n=1 Tax=Pontiella desulfatans TaxID=2750659 RepID=UPI001443CC98|nr:pilus assembly protein PilM [Pontiella desulfatans]